MIAGQTFQSFARVVLFSLLAAGALPAGAQAGDKWRLVQSTGQVTAGGAGLVPVAVRPNDALPKNGWLQTGPNGSAVLAHDRDTIIIGPLSRVQLPDETKAGNTQVIQSLGSALYQIGKEAAPHFQVDTPYLAAIVKGTTFVVSVGSDSARVDVTEGLVEVASPDGSSVEYIRPGHAGLVSHADGTSGRVNVIESRESREGLPSAAPGLLEQAEERGEREVLDSNQSDKVVVATSIGQVDLNIRAVS
jgi:ferric-dicitrate binding protein FerR (iron transport regulator)